MNGQLPSSKIGFFDSGIGGFTVLSAVRGALPQYDYLYYGDTLNVPYGNRTEEEVYTLTLTGIQSLFEKGASLAIIACNTSSAQTLRRMQDTLIPHVYTDKRILGVIIPTIETIIASHACRVLLIGTKRTVESKKYDRELALRNADTVELVSIATPELVPLIEDGRFEDAMRYLEGILGTRAGEADTLILGCTHYALLKHLIRMRYPHLHVVSQDEIIPAKLAVYLERHTDIRNSLGTNGTLDIILTKDDPAYRKKMLDLFAV